MCWRATAPGTPPSRRADGLSIPTVFNRRIGKKKEIT